uniref:Uncharacterized protein n=1 Tax=Vitrella brassicaformis TaxID=1169539 RepID=A0A7S1PCJ0_9ALVE|mmetsp:Transcript_48252/g.120803  ORF Transcript_48252/g.120803 Transcript_48252/m.120803 type:complete len:126 (+) Transcript_48252:191-568(+)
MANLTIDTSGADDEDALSDFDKSPTTPGGGALAESRLESISTMRQRGDDEEREGDEDELEEREEGEEEGPEEAPLLPPIDFDSEDYKLKQASISDDRKVWEVGRDASQKKIKGGKGGKKGKKGKA